MSCDKYLDLISARLDGPLSAEDAAALSAHLNTCPQCRAIADDLANIHGTLSGAAAVPPAELAQGVMKSIRAQRTTRKRTFRQLGTLAACLVLCVGLFTLTRPETTVNDQTPMTTRIVPDQPVTEELTFSNVQRIRLSDVDITALPSAALLNCAGDLSTLPAVAQTYDEEYFRTHRLLAVALWEPSSSISHTVSALTEDTVTILRDVPEAGDTDVALWLILAEVAGTGPETPLTVELQDN